MESTHASHLVSELKKLTVHLASIDESLKKLVGKEGLRLELGIHEKLDKMGKN